MLLLRRGGRLRQDTLLWRVQPPLQTARTMLWRMWTCVKAKQCSAHFPCVGPLVLKFGLSLFLWLQKKSVCSIGCFYNGEVLTNGQSIPDPGNMCSECTCQVASPYKHPPMYSGRLTSLDNVSYLFSHRVVQCDVQRGCVRQPSVLTQAPTPVAALSVMVTSLKRVILQIM